MSVEGVEKVIRKAVVDVEFQETLFTNLEQALEGFDLTDDECALFKDLEEGGLRVALSESDAGGLEERISKIGGWN